MITTFPNYQSVPTRMPESRMDLFIKKDFQGASVLDIGCNEGKMMELFKSFGAKHVKGIDYDPTFQKTNNPDIVCADLDDDWTWENLGKFDVITILSVTKWVKDPKKLLKNCFAHATKIIYLEMHQLAYEKDNSQELLAGLKYSEIQQLDVAPIGRPFYRIIK